MPSTTLSSTSRSARSAWVTSAARMSLSPKLIFTISSVLIVSFSLMIGTRAQLVDGVDRVAEVQEARAVVDVLAREQDLGDGQLVRLERLRPGVHQPPLPHRGDGLELGEIGRPLGQIQLAQTPPRSRRS